MSISARSRPDAVTLATASMPAWAASTSRLAARFSCCSASAESELS
ncbi:hypothetical protein [Nocardiopsis gilva]|nr:hypothetical protein [Nocardiopsis gilva]